MPERVGGVGKAIAAEVESAETFGESDVSLGHTRTVVTDESVGLGNSVPLPPINCGDDNDSDINVEEYAGAFIKPKIDLDGVSGVISANTGEINRLSLIRTSDDTQLEFKSGVFTAGDSFTLSASLSAGEEYAVRADGGGSDTYTMGYDTGTDTPIEGDAMSVEHGYFGGNITSFIYNFSELSPIGPAKTGSVIVGWPYPPDVYGWDTVLFKRTLDNEAVDVYVEEDQAGGWTEVAGPVARGDAIPADPSNNVRYRIEFSRSDTANNPTMDAIYRRRKL